MANERGSIEKSLLGKNLSLIGVDEVGRGCLAGPVYAACVALDYPKLWSLDPDTLSLIRDSKTLSAKQRSTLLPLIHSISKEAYVATASVREIETKGILNATFLAMHRALSLSKVRYDVLLIDGKQNLPGYSGKQQAIVKGDFYCYSIAAASILAKEARDLMMRESAVQYPHYGFEDHVGYGTKRHLESISQHGICPLHRRNFAPIRTYVENHPI